MTADKTAEGRRLMGRMTTRDEWGPCLGFWATTYQLQSDFVETDFLPALLNLGAWDDRHWTSRIAMERELNGMQSATVMVDARGYCGRPRSLRIEVIPAQGFDGSKLHAKVLLIVHENAVRLTVGSANLTEPGYRQNIEIAASLVATSGRSPDAHLIREALSGIRPSLEPWRSHDADLLMRLAAERLAKPTQEHAAHPDTFAWSDRHRPLHQQFLQRWPPGEQMHKLTIVSPFWSEENGNGPLSTFLRQLGMRGLLADGAEVILITEAASGAPGRYVPTLPLSYACFDFRPLNVRCCALPVDPSVSREDAGRDDVLIARPLHAKVVLAEGKNSALAYVGSANFTRSGWGLGTHNGEANIEAGLIVRRSGDARAELQSLIPATIGIATPLCGSSDAALQPLEPQTLTPPWPTFLRDVRLSPTDKEPQCLDMVVSVHQTPSTEWWRICLGSGTDAPPVILVGSSDSTLHDLSGTYRRRLSTDELDRILRDQEIHVQWCEHQQGCAYPVNVAADARGELPISPEAGTPTEQMLLAYYQGRIAYEELFPPSGHVAIHPAPGDVIPSGVDTSGIQSYQIREFVESLEGLSDDLKRASLSERSMRLALLGQVSPVALSRTVLSAAEAGSRTSTAAGFQLVEILRCLQDARSLPGAEYWNQHLAKAISRVESDLVCLCRAHPRDLGPGTAFAKYSTGVIDALGKEATC